MGGAIHNKKDQMNYLNNRVTMVLNVLDAIDPEDAGVEDIDRIIDMLDDIEFKCKQFRHSLTEE